MKRTKIKIVEDGKFVEILSIENVAKAEDIERIFGSEVLQKYINGYPYYIHSTNNIGQIYIRESAETIEWFALGNGFKIRKEGFFSAVEILKKCGRRLQKIVYEQRRMESAKTIII